MENTAQNVQNDIEFNNENGIDLAEVHKKNLIRNFHKSHSVISSDSGSVRYEHDYDLEDLLPNLQVQNIKLEDDFYISSEDESGNMNLDLEKTRALNQQLKEESKFNMSFKEKRQTSIQKNDPSGQQGTCSQTSPKKVDTDEQICGLKSNSSGVMHDDWFFSEEINGIRPLEMP
ncbi:unnamed protein product [Brachionus calyciflorus]|uniref:Uncharacterized protein n=1 Tax=Brachionus calyciflorus TaxID=104777 RepID=A0A814R419_9BILA|nr:unnamed protein product [Brachionus calyciflorus]